jgi:tetratricopeptide (TPR) repeat protein
MRYSALFILTILLTSIVPCFSSTEVQGDSSALRAQLDADPKNLKLRHDLGNQLYKEKKYEDAIQVLKVGIEDQKSDTQLLLARSYNRLKDYLNEFRVLSLIIANDEKNFLAHTQMGYYYLVQKRTKGNRDGIINSFKEALKHNKKFLPAYEGLIKYFSETEDKNSNYQLRMIYQDMIEIFGRKAKYVSELCRLNSTDGYLDTAKTFCSEGIRLDPKKAENHVYLGVSLINQQENEQADKVLKKAAEDFKDSSMAQLAYADFLAQQKNYIKAEKYYLQATQADNQSAKAFIGYGQDLIEQKKYEDALPVFQRACELDNKKTMAVLKKVTTTIRLDNQTQWDDKYAQVLGRCLPLGQ